MYIFVGNAQYMAENLCGSRFSIPLAKQVREPSCGSNNGRPSSTIRSTVRQWLDHKHARQKRKNLACISAGQVFGGAGEIRTRVQIGKSRTVYMFSCLLGFRCRTAGQHTCPGT